MSHPEILALPFLMLADYYLTLYGVALREKGWSQHFKTPHHELNPVWQKSIAEKRWFNPKHLFLTVVLSGVLIYLLGFVADDEDFSRVIVGGLFGIYGTVIGRHIQNLLMCWRMNRRPQEVSGQIIFTHEYALHMSMSQFVPVVIVAVVVAIASADAFAIGAAIGSAYVVFLHLNWMWRAAKQRKRLDRVSD
jgi:hypothetical protein